MCPAGQELLPCPDTSGLQPGGQLCSAWASQFSSKHLHSMLFRAHRRNYAHCCSCSNQILSQRRGRHNKSFQRHRGRCPRSDSCTLPMAWKCWHTAWPGRLGTSHHCYCSTCCLRQHRHFRSTCCLHHKGSYCLLRFGSTLHPPQRRCLHSKNFLPHTGKSGLAYSCTPHSRLHCSQLPGTCIRSRLCSTCCLRRHRHSRSTSRRLRKGSSAHPSFCSIDLLVPYRCLHSTRHHHRETPLRNDSYTVQCSWSSCSHCAKTGARSPHRHSRHLDRSPPDPSLPPC